MWNSPSLVAGPARFQGRLGVVICPSSSSVNSVWYNPEKDFERLQDVLLNLVLFLKRNLLTYDIHLATPYSSLMLGQLVINPTMIRPIQGTTEWSIPWSYGFLNTPVFTQMNLWSIFMILFYSIVIISLLYNH